ncbi:Ribosomal protein S20 [Syntrophomonas zehnderi OL-4]|uniref:Small ribosomal subunit protein bS20 n=1 Tax=Syntrophomonas zehnderi OL-4 TaxID=690567 RepID=A0A0E4C9J8_9FIRM|nr:Ribosomal protein S20 [Syntrophomonas zehnderi OL-4]
MLLAESHLLCLLRCLLVEMTLSSLILHFKIHNAIVFLLALHIQGGETVAKSKTPAKRARIAEDNRLRNKAYKSKLKTSVKAYEASLSADNVEAARENLIKVTSLIDKSVSKGVLHKNTAARKKSALAKKLNAMNTIAE